VLAPKGTIARIEALRVSQAVANSGFECGMYVNPAFVSSMEVSNASIQTPQFAYIEAGTAEARFVDCDIASYDCVFASGADATLKLYKTVIVVSDRARVVQVGYSGGIASTAVPAGVSKIRAQYGEITATKSTVDSYVTVAGNAVLISGTMAIAVGGNTIKSSPTFV